MLVPNHSLQTKQLRGHLLLMVVLAAAIGLRFLRTSPTGPDSQSKVSTPESCVVIAEPLLPAESSKD